MQRLKKSLGQHFLRDENICCKIVQALPTPPNMNLLEIGPGGGALTKYLLQLKDIHFKAIEVDEEKVIDLLRDFPALQNKLLHEDILHCAIPFDSEFNIIGNFPYNISSQILFRILAWKVNVNSVTGMFQKEVARRICSKNNNKEYGILSVLVQAYYNVEYLFEVDENCFVPPPKVKSAVIRLTRKATLPAVSSEKELFLLVKTAFGQRRKKLRNPLKNLFEKEILKDEVFDKRAEQLSVEDFINLTHKMKTATPKGAKENRCISNFRAPC